MYLFFTISISAGYSHSGTGKLTVVLLALIDFRSQQKADMLALNGCLWVICFSKATEKQEWIESSEELKMYLLLQTDVRLMSKTLKPF